MNEITHPAPDTDARWRNPALADILEALLRGEEVPKTHAAERFSSVGIPPEAHSDSSDTGVRVEPKTAPEEAPDGPTAAALDDVPAAPAAGRPGVGSARTAAKSDGPVNYKERGERS